MLGIVRHYAHSVMRETGWAQGLVGSTLGPLSISLAAIAIVPSLGGSTVSAFSEANGGVGAP